ncbi:MAG: hypothetical protein SOU06_07710 [Bulleidia sp.]|nr:hypothetical protein [Erysipelotrichaceae bacterium]MDY2781399.1 hypothetical protein [Bulleidia sp.]
MESITKDKAYPFFVDGYYEGYVDGIEEGMKAREDSISQFMENMVAVVKMNLKDCSVKEIEKKLDLTEEEIGVMLGVYIKLVHHNVENRLES